MAEAARIVDVHPSTLTKWAKGYRNRFQGRPEVTGEPVITYIESEQAREPTIPFIGLVEAMVLAAVRSSGVPLQRVRPALAALQREIGVAHALASKKLYTDGAELLYDFGESRRQTDEGRSALNLVVVRSGQRVFTEAIESYLRRIQYGEDGYAELIRVPAYEHADVVADPSRAFGAPVFSRGGAKVVEVLERFWAGESIDDLTGEFGVPSDQLEDVLRVASRRAA